MTTTATMLRDLARHLLATPLPDGELDARMAALDWYGLLVPEDRGGAGGTVADALTIVEGLARAGRPGRYLHTALLAPAVLSALPASPRARDALARAAAGNSGIGALLDVVAARPHLVLDDHAGRSVLSGVSEPVAAGDVDVLAAVLTDGTAVVVPAGRAGAVEVRSHGVEPMRRWSFDAVEIPPEDVVRLASEDVDNVVSRAALAGSAALLGSAARAAELTLDYVRSRTQFDKPLGAFQAVQMRCAEVARDLLAVRAILDRAVAATDAGAPDAHRLASACRVYAGDAATRIAQQAHTLHGAIGFTAEYELNRHSRAILANRLSLGAAGFHRRLLSDGLPAGIAPTSPDWNAR